ncbi:MAG: hypothetical protein KGI25_09035 [Thaumarchaeota archaeon]|nr:hypothetical protein [Nitrososphaerota archaeon]
MLEDSMSLDPIPDHTEEKEPNILNAPTGRDEDRVKWSDMGTKMVQRTTTNTKTTTRLTKKNRLLANPDIKRWYDNLARGSPITAETRLRRLSHFCETHQMTPMQFAQLGMSDLRAVTDLLQDHITWMEEQDMAPQYIETTMTALKSWLRHFDVEVKRKLKVANAKSTPSLEQERVPEAMEMAEIMSRAGIREGAIISLIAKSGLRLQVLGNHDGTDGLTIKDLPDIAIVQGVAKCLQTPPRVIVRRTLSKARHQYFTFLTDSATKRVLAYLNDRLAKEEVLNGESAVIAPNYEYKYGRHGKEANRFLVTNHISIVIRNILRPRFQWRPYVLRAYFDTQLLVAEARGKIAHDFRVFFMGHKGSIEAKYTTNKGILPDSLTIEMREAFRRSQEFLDLETKEEDPLLKQKQELQLAIEKATPEKVQEMLRVLNVCKS